VDKLIATVRDGDVWRQRRMGLHQVSEGTGATTSTDASPAGGAATPVVVVGGAAQ